MPVMSAIVDADAESAKYVFDARFARPVPPLAERARRRSAKPFVLTSEGLCKFIRDHTRTPEEALEFFHDLGCTWDKDGKVMVHPI